MIARTLRKAARGPRGFWRRLARGEGGNTLLIMGMSAPILVTASGLAVDTINWTLNKRQLQRAADSAAIAGSYQLLQTTGLTEVTAAVTKDLALNNHAGTLSGTPVVARENDADGISNRVRVELTMYSPSIFSSIIGRSSQKVTAIATAGTTGVTGEYCVVSLEPSTYSGIYGSGNALVVMDCGMITNSRSKNSAIAKGNSDIHATVLAAMGGIQKSANWNVANYAPYSAQQADPYASAAPVTPTSCVPGTVLNGLPKNNPNADTPAEPGCYSSINVNSNHQLKLGAGQYFVNGGNIDIQGAVSGTNVSLVLSNISSATDATIGNLTMNANGSLNITAPTDSTNPLKGIAIYQDRRATSDQSVTYDPQVDNGGNLPNNSPNKINGNSDTQITGAIYFPKQRVVWNGGGTSTATCTLFVVRQIVFNGNNSTSNFTRNCTGTGVDLPDTIRRVRLVR